MHIGCAFFVEPFQGQRSRKNGKTHPMPGRLLSTSVSSINVLWKNNLGGNVIVSSISQRESKIWRWRFVKILWKQRSMPFD